MNDFSIDYSLYKYKIVDLEIQDWPDCFFTLIFKRELSKIELEEIKNSIDKWFTKSQNKSPVGGFHFLDFLEQENLKALQFTIDFGSAELDVLKSLLDLLSQWSAMISVLEIGQRPKNINQKYIYETTNFPGVAIADAPFKVTQIVNNEMDWPLTLYFNKDIDPVMKNKLQKTINDWYSEIKSSKYATNPWIQSIDWQDDKTASWWMSGQSGEAAIFNSLVDRLVQFSEIIEELVIGKRFPDREKVNYLKV